MEWLRRTVLVPVPLSTTFLQTQTHDAHPTVRSDTSQATHQGLDNMYSARKPPRLLWGSDLPNEMLSSNRKKQEWKRNKCTHGLTWKVGQHEDTCWVGEWKTNRHTLLLLFIHAWLHVIVQVCKVLLFRILCSAMSGWCRNEPPRASRAAARLRCPMNDTED